MRKKANKKPKICFNTMVKNEAPTIERMLNSVWKYIDYWVIQDNGSEDGTQDIIKNFFEEKGIPGFLYQIWEWKGHGWNRDHTLQTALKANHGCDWILRVDADEQLQVDDDFDWSVFKDTSIQSFNIMASAGDSVYYRTWIWNAKLPWYFVHDLAHETIHLPDVGENFQRVNLPSGIRHVITNDGMTWYKPMKFLKDALNLEITKVTTNEVLDNSYHLWYIGKSYNDAYTDTNGLPFGKAHSDEYARRCIFYFKMYLDKHHNFSHTHYPAYIDDMGYYACLLIGKAYRWLGEYSSMLFYYNTATRFNPRRNEHYIDLALYYQEIEQWANMLEITTVLTSQGRTNPFPDYNFLIENSAYQDTGTLCGELHKTAQKYVWGL